jgi:hypothetical protein
MRTLFHPLILAAAWLCLFIAPALATDLFFRDITSKSDNARYRLEAKSPDNQKPGRQPFAGSFTYTLTDTKQQKVLWTHKQQGWEPSPSAAWVHDSGWVVVRLHGDELVAFDPVNGAVTGTVKILDQFPQAEASQFVQQTSAGPMWAQSSRWYFLDVDGKLCFVVRAHWGRRVIMELASGKLIADSGDVKAMTDKKDRQWVLATLKQDVSRLLKAQQGEGPPMEVVIAVKSAIDIAVNDQIQDAVPFLREAEKSEYVGTSGGQPIFVGDQKLPKGAIDPFQYSVYTVRHKAQTALRKLGETPSELPALAFKPVGRFQAKAIIKPTPSEPRAAALPKIHAGQSPMDVLKAVGGPDRIHWAGREIAWEYHVDGKNSHSVHVFWSQKAPPVVTNIETVAPPTWQGESDLD